MLKGSGIINNNLGGERIRKQVCEGEPAFLCVLPRPALAILLIILFLSSCDTNPLPAGASEVWTNNQIANAIYKAENSKAHPYGILTHYKHTTPRQACINTIEHARRDWNGKGDFIEFLGNRYCPIGAKNDPKGLNKNWVKNVKYFLLNP